MKNGRDEDENTWQIILLLCTLFLVVRDRWKIHTLNEIRKKIKNDVTAFFLVLTAALCCG